MSVVMTRTLGARSVRAVGFGELSLAIAAARGIDRADVARALGAALEAGIDFVDVAAEEDAERVAGETLRAMRLRDKVVAATRIHALAATPSGAPTRNALVDRLPPRYVVARVEAALRATRLDALPLAQLELRAAWRASSAWPELADTCARLVREGKVLAWGGFVTSMEDDTVGLVAEPWLVSLSVPYSLCERAGDSVLAAAATHAAPSASADAAARPDLANPSAAAREPTSATSIEQAPEQLKIDPMLVIAAGLPAHLVLAAADGKLVLPDPMSGADTATAAATTRTAPMRSAPIAVLARRPLAGGALAGTLGPGVKLRLHDDRNLDGRTLERIAIGVAKLAAFTKHVPLAATSFAPAKAQLEQNRRAEQLRYDTVAELALRFVLGRGAIALPRLHRREHVAAALAAAHAPPLPPDVVDGLDI